MPRGAGIVVGGVRLVVGSFWRAADPGRRKRTGSAALPPWNVARRHEASIDAAFSLVVW